MNCGARAGRTGTIVAIFLVVPSLFAQAQPAPKQETAKQEFPKYEVTGFREARFGMTEPDVRAVVAKALAVKPADLKTSSNPTEGTTLLTARADQLEPGPGPATITYIFGNKSKRLIQVNVAWGEDAPGTRPIPMQFWEQARGSNAISKVLVGGKIRPGWEFHWARIPSFCSPARTRKKARCASSSTASSIR